MATKATSPFNHHLGRLLACGALLTVMVACDSNSSSPAPAPAPTPTGPKTPTTLTRSEDAPGVVVQVVKLMGASGADGSFRAGDSITVNFTLKKRDGTFWQVDEFSRGRAMVSGPTFHYQRVLPEVRDLPEKAVYQADGSYNYTFADAIPATYAAPINDSTAFGPGDGELSGEPLLAGTYTVGMYFGWDYTVGSQSFRDTGDTTFDFLYGGATTLEPRQVVKIENCNSCHADLQFHGGLRRSPVLCALCHTAGAEDDNSNGNTPGVSIELGVMIHKLHNAAHLPSVLGVATNADGSRNYAATPQPYVIGRNGGDDFSHIHFPVWPNLSVAMPRDMGHTSLTTTEQGLEDEIRRGVTACAACHGDPDGSGPLTAPSQGNLAYTQMTRRACGSCHDDIDWSRPYTANGATMPPQPTDGACNLCHSSQTPLLDPAVQHVHPLKNPTFNPGFHITVSAVAEAGTHNNDGTIDPGEKVAVTFRMVDDSGADVAPSAVASMSLTVVGPTENQNIVLNATFPTAALSGAQPFTSMLPEMVYFEPVGVSTSTGGESWTTPRTPHWNVSGTTTTVRVRTATSGGDSTLAAAVPAYRNYVDVVSVTGFARNDFIVIDDGVSGMTEYLQIQWVDGNRLWFSSPYTPGYKPGVKLAHAMGATVKEVTLTTKAAGTDYTLNASTGAISEVTEFGNGNAVVVSYTTDFVMPAEFPLALNDTPSLDESSGEWAGKPIVDGTYAVTIWGYRNLPLTLFGQTQTYRANTIGARKEFLVGSATTLQPYDLISSGANCYSCHHEIGFHGYGRFGYETCLACHGTAGSEDRPRYVAPNAPATDGLTVNFREMIHKIHMGADLANASTYSINGFGSTAHPNNFTPHSYDEVRFPAWPGGAARCITCHGADNTAWKAPLDRNHPLGQTLPTRSWTVVCASCHDSSAATAHISAMTSAQGAESCRVCHDTNKEWNVELMHKNANR